MLMSTHTRSYPRRRRGHYCAVGTREGSAVGGSFNAALLRMQGTVIGAMFAFALVTAIPGDLLSGAGAGQGRLFVCLLA
jgi:hypothetical protein